MQRVDPAVLDGAARRHEGLGRHLAAEDPLALLVGLDPAEDVDLDGLEVEQVDQEVQGVAHGTTCIAGRSPTRPRSARRRPGRRPPLPVPAALGTAERRYGTGPCRPSTFPTASSGGRPPPPTRSRAATSTTTGGRWSTTPPPGASSRAATPATRSTAGPRTSHLVADLGLGAYRFSLEWSRIEPAEGEFSLVALDHYRRMCAACPGTAITARGHLPPLHHPALADGRRGGGRRLHAPERFARFVRPGHRPPGRPDRMGLHHQRAQRGGDHGVLPRRSSRPGYGDLVRRGAVNEAMVARPPHRPWRPSASGPGDFPVGLTLSMAEIQVEPGGEEWLRAPADDRCREHLPARPPAGDDFVGVQCYTRKRFGPEGSLAADDRTSRTTQMGYECWPEALEHTVRRACGGDAGVPVVVTENGIATADDAERIEFVTRGPRRASAAAWTTGSTCGATSSGACWTISSGSWATGPSSGWWRWTGHLRAPAQAECALVRGGRPGQRSRDSGAPSQSARPGQVAADRATATGLRR